MKLLLIQITACCLLFLAFSKDCFSQQAPLRVGKHNLTLQWIGWDKPGSVQITQKKGIYSIKGSQKSTTTADSLTIDGQLKVLNASELLFTGTIVIYVSYNNNGEPCLREGEYHFKATGKRKYWRLQEMESCEGNSVVDYIDIYF